MKNPNGCTGENCPLVNIPENGCKVNVCPWLTKDNSFETIYGYPVGELFVFAESCRLQGISPDELHNHVLNLAAAYETVYRDLKETWDKSMRLAFGVNENEKGETNEVPCNQSKQQKATQGGGDATGL